MSDNNINWNMSGEEIERESFTRIEHEIGAHNLSPENWRVARRIIHAVGDVSILSAIKFHGDPVKAGLSALRDGAPVYCDANMIRAGLSLARLKHVNPEYSAEKLHCLVSDEEVIARAKQQGIARALVALDKARELVHGGIVLIGNSPLALAGIVKMHLEEKITPRLVIGMPVGFVHVVESKEMLAQTNLPYILIKGRRGGSSSAVAALHGITESHEKR